MNLKKITLYLFAVLFIAPFVAFAQDGTVAESPAWIGIAVTAGSWLIGYAMKNWIQFIPNHAIPWILVIGGIIAGIISYFVSADPNSVYLPLLTIAATGLHQLENALKARKQIAATK